MNPLGPLESTGDLRQFLAQTSPTVPVWQFVLAFLATAVLCYLLAVVYRRFGHSLSNRGSFARNFVMIGTTTMLIISIVKSSLALSLGLVGALSIVRFRTAIKEPEELGYLFMTIAIGLGFGANQWLITLTAFALIVGLMWARHLMTRHETESNLYLTVREDQARPDSLEAITRVLEENSAGLDLKRFDQRDSTLEVSYRISFGDFAQLDRAKRALSTHSPSIAVSFVDNEAVL